MEIIRSDRRTAPLGANRASSTYLASWTVSSAPSISSTPTAGRHIHSTPSQPPLAVLSRHTRNENAPRPAPTRKNIHLLALVTAPYMRVHVGCIALYVAPDIADWWRMSRACSALLSRTARASQARALRLYSLLIALFNSALLRDAFATLARCFRMTRAIMLAYWRECDAIVARMNSYPLCNSGATHPMYSRRFHATRRSEVQQGVSS